MYKLCPNCGALADYDSYFAAYKCAACGWTDDSPAAERQRRLVGLADWLRKIGQLFKPGEQTIVCKGGVGVNPRPSSKNPFPDGGIRIIKGR